MWERLRPRTNNRRMLGILRAVAAWREREAQRVNIPRQRLIKDEALLEIAALAPETADQLGRARGVTRGFAEGRTGATLLAAIADAKLLPESDLPTAPRDRDGPRPSPALVSLLKVLLAAKCEEHNVAPKLVASSDDIDRLAGEDAPAIAALGGGGGRCSGMMRWRSRGAGWRWWWMGSGSGCEGDVRKARGLCPLDPHQSRSLGT